MFSFKRWREKYGGLTLRSLWDLFMVWVVIINLTLILFDLTYLWLRPHYFEYLPIITRIYDPVLGIEPHPLTDALIDRAAEGERFLELDPTAPALDDLLFDLETLTTRVFLEDPFLRSGQTENLAAMWTTMARETGKTVSSTENPGIVAEVAREFWTGPPALLRHRFALFDEKIEPRLAVNYFRGFNLDGRLIDNFWNIDLPFLVLFWIEFMVRWFIALRRKTYARWYFFPIFYWYDLLSLIPVTALRPLRLLRVVSIYMRLRQSDISQVGKDLLSRGVAYISGIITEEVSDRVAIRILDEYREEIVNGTHIHIARTTVKPRREQIERVLVHQIRAILTDEETIEKFRQLLQLNLANAVEESESLRSLPLPHMVVKPVVSAVGEIILDTTLETISKTIDSDEGQDAVQALADSILEAIFYGPALGEIESLAKDISIQVIDHMKEVVVVKKWALPEEEGKRPAMPWEAEEEGEQEF